MEKADFSGDNVDLTAEIEQALSLAQRAIPYTISLKPDARRAYLRREPKTRSKFVCDALVFYDQQSKILELSDIAQQAAEIAIRKLVAEGVIKSGDSGKG